MSLSSDDSKEILIKFEIFSSTHRIIKRSQDESTIVNKDCQMAKTIKSHRSLKFAMTF